jgi:hypothetical protein
MPKPELRAGGAVIKLTTGAGFTNYGSGSATLDYAIEIVLCWVIWAKKWLKDASIHVRKNASQRM